MSTYTKIVRVQTHDLDSLQHVNNVRYVEWIQDISREHWESQVKKSLQGELIWVVRNHNITYHGSTVLNDRIEISTRVEAWRGPISVRKVEMRDNKTKKLLVMASTEWCALHPKTLKPVRVPEEVQQLFTNNG